MVQLAGYRSKQPSHDTLVALPRKLKRSRPDRSNLRNAKLMKETARLVSKYHLRSTVRITVMESLTGETFHEARSRAVYRSVWMLGKRYVTVARCCRQQLRIVCKQGLEAHINSSERGHASSGRHVNEMMQSLGTCPSQLMPTNTAAVLLSGNVFRN